MMGVWVAVAQLSIWVSAPSTTALCEPLAVTVGASAPGSDPPQLVAPDLRPFSIASATVASRVDTDAEGHTWTTTEHRYLLTIDRTGTFAIRPFETRLGASVARSRTVRVTVRPTMDSTAPAIVARAVLDSSLAVNFRAMMDPDTVFVGQQATYQVAVFVDDEVRERLHRNPTFYPPDLRSMLAYELPAPKGELVRRRAGARCYSALVFQRAVFPLVSGRLVVPPAQLSLSLPNRGFFGREENVELRTDSVQIVAVEPPDEGRPVDFSGVVGNVSISASVDSSLVRVGDPVRVSIRVAGTGNVKLFPWPELVVPWAGIVPVQERVRIDSTGLVVHGTKEFEWLVTPRVEGEHQLPSVHYPFFNPIARRYELAATQAETLHVGAGSLAILPSSAADTPAPLSLRPVLHAPVPVPLTDRSVFWMVLGALPLPALVGAAARRRPRRALTPQRRLRTIARARGAPASALRAAYIAAVAARVPLDSTATTARGALSRALRRAGVSDRTANEADAVLAALDQAAYSRPARPAGNLAARAQRVFRAIEWEARAPRSSAGGRGRGGVVRGIAVMFAMGTLPAVAGDHGSDPVERAFARGLAAYSAREYDVAANAFALAARTSPRSSDAWANAGTASWASGDTAAAVVGWQRALRLEPFAEDVRERLGLLVGGTSGLAFVPPLPPDALTIAAAIAWILGWSLLVRRRGPQGNIRRPVAIVAAAAAAIGLSVWVDGLLAAHDLVVIRPQTVARPLPALAAEVSARLPPGEVARVVGREGEWTHIVLSAGNDGWVEAAHLVSLSRD